MNLRCLIHGHKAEPLYFSDDNPYQNNLIKRGILAWVRLSDGSGLSSGVSHVCARCWRVVPPHDSEREA